MTIVQRLQLLKAGYSREEIKSFEELEQQEPQSQDHAAEDQQQEEAAEPAPASAAQQGKEIDIPGLIAAEVQKAMQRANINNAAVDQLPKQTAEQALAEGVFGNPPTK